MNKNDKSGPLVSIVVPAYNVERYYARAIESMLSQSYKNIEILLIDDGSRDRSGKIADSYAEKDKRIISIHQKNAGVSVARNVGMRNAKGEYVTFVDPDDYLETTAIETMVNLAIKQKVDVVRTRCRTYRNDRKIENDYGIEVGLYANEKLEELAYRAALHYSHDAISCCWLLLIKKDVLDGQRVRFVDGIVIMQDIWFYVDLLRSIKSLYSDESITYNYMMNDGGTISSKTRFAEKIDSMIKLYGYVMSVWKDDEQKQRQLTNQYSALIAIRTINSATISIGRSKELLKIVSQYRKLFDTARTQDLGLRHRLYIYAIRRNSALLIVLLAFARKVAIVAKG